MATLFGIVIGIGIKYDMIALVIIGILGIISSIIEMGISYLSYNLHKKMLNS